LATCGRAVSRARGAARRGRRDRHPARRLRLEVHEVADGLDRYRDAVSWTPYTSLGHARAAGAALARLHVAADRFRCGPLSCRAHQRCELIVAADRSRSSNGWPAGARGWRPTWTAGAWPDDLTRHVLPAIWRAAPLLAGLPRSGHGDWHPSNLTWTSAGPDAVMAGCSTSGWPTGPSPCTTWPPPWSGLPCPGFDLIDLGRAEADLDAIDALLDGYESVRPLTPAEAAALPEVFPVVTSSMRCPSRVLRRRGQARLPTPTWPTTVTSLATPPGSGPATAPPPSTTSAARGYRPERNSPTPHSHHQHHGPH